MVGALGQQLLVDLGGALPAAHDGDRAQPLQVRLVPQVVRRVQSDAAGVEHGSHAGRHVRLGADAEREPPAAERLTGAGVDRVRLAVVLDAQHAATEPHGAQAVSGPAAVLVVLAAQRVEGLADVKRVEVPDLLEVVQERPARGRVGHRHEVGQERHLQGGVVEQQAGVPGQVVAGLEEHRVDLGQRLEQAGQSEVERPDADADQVVHVLGARRAHAASRRASRAPSATRCSTEPSTCVAVVAGSSSVSFSQRSPSTVVAATIVRPEA